MSFFQVLQLSAGYGGKKIVKDISFSVQAGQMVGILGVNGSGKTTLLKAICNFLPHQGECLLYDTENEKTSGVKNSSRDLPGSAVRLESLSVKKLAGLCSYIPQRSGISIDISVLDVVLMGFNPKLGLLEQPDGKMRERACRMLREVGLAGKEEMNYQQLSEGQKQLCILARTLTEDTRLMLLDEPESSLDLRFRYRMMEILRKRLKEGNSSAIAVLHDPIMALNFCDRLLLLADRTLSGEITPAADDQSEMEQKLSMLYGPVSLMKCEDKTGHTQLIMIKEPEER